MEACFKWPSEELQVVISPSVCVITGTKSFLLVFLNHSLLLVLCMCLTVFYYLHFVPSAVVRSKLIKRIKLCTSHIFLHFLSVNQLKQDNKSFSRLTGPHPFKALNSIILLSSQSQVCVNSWNNEGIVAASDCSSTCRAVRL